MTGLRRAGIAGALLTIVSALAASAARGAGRQEDPPPVPTPREVFLSGIEALREAPPGEFPARLGAWVDRRLAEGAGEPTERARERRRSFLAGAGALFDAGDTLRNVPILGRAFAEIVRDDEKPLRDAICSRARLHGRHDAPKHFFISAALAARGGPAAAAQASLLKEIEDSRRFEADPPYGSGFSFLDLAYDHAGIRFATWLLGWKEEERLGRAPPPLDAFLPAFPDLELPERIGWQRFRDEYRGERTTEILDRVHAAVDERLQAHAAAAAPGDTSRGNGTPASAPPTDRNGQSP